MMQCSFLKRTAGMFAVSWLVWLVAGTFGVAQEANNDELFPPTETPAAAATTPSDSTTDPNAPPAAAEPPAEDPLPFIVAGEKALWTTR